MEIEEYIEQEGYKYEVAAALADTGLIMESDAEKLLEFMEDNLNVFSADETFERVCCDQYGKSYTTSRYRYYINIKTITLVALIYLLDYKITGGMLGFLSAAAGLKEQAIVKIKEENGEKCILKELLCNKRRKGDKHILRKFKGECCNNHFNCFYRKEERCECGKERVTEILKSFEERNIVKKQGWLYQVQL